MGWRDRSERPRAGTGRTDGPPLIIHQPQEGGPLARRGAPDGDFVQAAWLGAAMGGSAVLVFAFNAALGRLLGPAGLATFGALLRVVVPLSGAGAPLLCRGAPGRVPDRSP